MHRWPLSSALRRIAVLAGVWWVLTDGALGSWVIGIPAVVLAAGASLILRRGGPPGRTDRQSVLRTAPWRIAGLVRFVAFFLRHSLVGGLDVAWRAFHPRLPLQPEFKQFALRLPDGSPRVLLIDIVSLLPGTLAAELDGDRLTLHVLDVRQPVEPTLRQLEDAIAAMCGLWLAAPDEETG